MKNTEDIATLEELAKMKRKISPDREITLPVSLANVDSRLDLFFAPEKHTAWTNIYKSEDGVYANSGLFESKEEALENSYSLKIATCKIEWEE